MRGEASLLPVINRLYAAAAESGLWHEAMKSLAETMNASHCILVAGNPSDGSGFVTSAYLENNSLSRVLSPEALQLAQPSNHHTMR